MLAWDDDTGLQSIAVTNTGYAIGSMVSNAGAPPAVEVSFVDPVGNPLGAPIAILRGGGATWQEGPAIGVDGDGLAVAWTGESGVNATYRPYVFFHALGCHTPGAGP